MWKIYGLDIRKLTEQGLLEEYLGRLPAERQAHIRNIKNTAEQYRSMGAGLLLEYGLAQAGVPAEDAKVLRGKYGKPYLAQDQESSSMYRIRAIMQLPYLRMWKSELT